MRSIRGAWALAPMLVLAGCRLSSSGTGTDVELPDAEGDTAIVPPDTASDGEAVEAEVVAPTCSDGLRNGDETDVDCGGPTCGKCGAGKKCNGNSDCVGDDCTGGVCGAPACDNGKKDGAESDVDCGGGTCPKCAVGKGCNLSADCTSGFCAPDNKCVTANCGDGIKNGTETDIDCGGDACPACPIGKGCVVASDCSSVSCGALKKCEPQTSCKSLHAAAPTLPSGVYVIDPDGAAGINAPFGAYCEMSVDGGGWTFFAHVNGDYGGGKLFEADVGTYRADRIDDATTYGRGGTILPYLGHSQMMVALDAADPAIAVTTSKLAVFSYAIGAPAFNKGPIPCTGLGATFSYRTTLIGPFTAGSANICDADHWYARNTGNTAHLVLFIGGGPLGNFWGSGMGGTESWLHDGWWYAR